jgi:hypothetical protein
MNSLFPDHLFSEQQKQKKGSNGPFPYLADVPPRSALSDVADPAAGTDITHPCAQQKSLTRRLSCIKKDLVAGAGFEPATFGL